MKEKEKFRGGNGDWKLQQSACLYSKWSVEYLMVFIPTLKCFISLILSTAAAPSLPFLHILKTLSAKPNFFFKVKNNRPSS